MAKKTTIRELRLGAQSLLREGRSEEARIAYVSICGHKDCSADDWFMLGIISGQLGHFDQSASSCKKAVQMNPHNSAAYYALGMAMHAKGEPKIALEYYKSALRIDPKNKDLITHYRAVKHELTRGKKLVLKVRGGINISVPQTLECLTTYVLLEQEDWFENEVKFIREILHGGESVLDIGANYGVYTNVMASKVGKTGRVYAFEPASETAAFLKEGIGINNFRNTILKQVALSNYSGEGRLQTESISECNRLLRDDEIAASEIVKVLTLDEAVMRIDCSKIGFVKIDAEGEEKNVIEGGKVFLASYSPLIMLEIKHNDKVSFDLIELLDRHGYDPYRLVPGLNLLVPFYADRDAGCFQLNLFFCKHDKLEELEKRGLLVTSVRDEVVNIESLAAEEAFLSFLCKLPFNTGFQELNLPESAKRLPGGEKYYDGLNHYALSRTESAPKRVRYASLLSAYSKVSEAYQLCATLPRTLSLVRIKTELGCQSDAATLLKALVANIETITTSDFHELFIPVLIRYESLDPSGSILEWIRSSLLELWEYVRSYTSYSDGVELVKELERLMKYNYFGNEIERRYQLKRLQTGLQLKPEFSQKLLGVDGECMNAAFWRSADD